MNKIGNYLQNIINWKKEAKEALPLNNVAQLGVSIFNKNNFQKEVIKSNLPVVLKAYADWCPPCKAMDPIFSEISKELSGKVKFVKFNIDDDSDLTNRLDIQTIPTFIFFKNGESVKTHVGRLPKDEFMNEINEVLLKG